MTRTAKILAFVATGSLVVLAMAAVAMTFVVGSCTREASAAMEQEKREQEELDRYLREQDKKLQEEMKNLPRPPKF